MNTDPSAFKIFSILFGIIYTLLFYFNYTVFHYYPVLREFHVGVLPLKTAGPSINWYAWVASATVVSAVIAFAVPRHWAERLPPVLSWALPVVLLVVVLIYEKRWFV
jgi:hypothetical protein